MNYTKFKIDLLTVLMLNILMMYNILCNINYKINSKKF